MRKFTSRGLIALGIVATLGLSTPALASAGPAGQGPAPSKTTHQGDAAYLAAHRAIQKAFHAAVAAAHASYQSALAAATTSSQRNTARQVYEAAIIQAAATRSAALTVLGPEPVKSASGQGKTN